MTALGAPAAPAVDAARIRRTYGAVLGDPRIGVGLTGDEQRAHLAGLLRGQLRLLLPVVEDRLPGMAGAFNRSAARYVLDEARTVLDVPVRGALPADAVFDLAVLSRSLLALHEYAASTRPPVDPSSAPARELCRRALIAPVPPGHQPAALRVARPPSCGRVGSATQSD
jgi:hypothetical protein